LRLHKFNAAGVGFCWNRLWDHRRFVAFITSNAAAGVVIRNTELLVTGWTVKFNHDYTPFATLKKNEDVWFGMWSIDNIYAIRGSDGSESLGRQLLFCSLTASFRKLLFTPEGKAHSFCGIPRPQAM
jgi:hypothetical protein